MFILYPTFVGMSIQFSYNCLILFNALIKGDVVMCVAVKIAQRIKETAKSKNVVLKTMLEDCGMNKNVLSTMTARGSIPQVENLAKIADYLGVTLDYLIGRTNQPNAIVKTTGYVMKENTIENNSNNGDNIINNSSVSPETDEMTSELIKRFSNLSFDEKIEVFNYIKNIKE